MKKKLTIKKMIAEAELFCREESKFQSKDLYGITDGKAVGTYIEHKFQDTLDKKYEYNSGSSTRGIDFPGEEINTDIKVTSIVQPQSSCPFRDAKQKIYGLGNNLLLFVYEKTDNPGTRTANLNFKSCSFIHKERTADYQTTKSILQMLKNDANADDIIAYLMDRNIPADEISLNRIAEEVLKNPPGLGYLTISNALQWRLQYQRIVMLTDEVDGIVKIVDQVKG
ncbi:MAG: restriction endonuclease [bacterium]|nr:restriction endonuclease [bacterium]